MFNPELVKELCLQYTGNYTSDMIVKTKSFYINEESDDIKWLIVIVDCAEAIKLVYNPHTEEIEDKKHFSLITF